MKVDNEIIMFLKSKVIILTPIEQQQLKTLLYRNTLYRPYYTFSDYKIEELQTSIEVALIDFRINGPSPGIRGSLLYSLREKLNIIRYSPKSDPNVYIKLLKVLVKYCNLKIRTNLGISPGGLCSTVITLTYNGVFTNVESHMLLKFISFNRPIPGELFYKGAYKDSSYFWKPFDISIRKGWVEYKIGQLEKVLNH